MKLKKFLDYIPGVGLISYSVKEYRARKGKSPMYNIKETHDRRALGIYALEVGYFAFALSWKVYAGNVIATGDWNPIHMFSKQKIENSVEKKNNLEKTIDYEKALKECY